MYIFAIQPGILCAVLQSAAQYFWYTINGSRYDKDIKQVTTGWQLAFSPFWVVNSVLLIMFSYDGWNSLNYSLDEFRRPEKKSYTATA
ncbi:unnamed protein product [Rhizophagus irregularis]|nr:unnamed protein product [Rhizophagus irregularis]